MHLIDSHCHLTFEDLTNDLDQVLARSRAAGVCAWITVGTDLEHSKAAVSMAQGIDHLYATVGWHPHDARTLTDEAFERLEALAGDTKCVAIGETGLDFHYDLSPRTDQERVFARQLDLAARLGLPVVVHTREAFDRTLAVLADFRSRLDRVVLHCFTGTAEQARQALDLGYYLSFSGAVTFKNAQSIREAARLVPMDRLMIETDCPYLSPEPMRKQRPNEPALLIHTAARLSETVGVDPEALAEAAWSNTNRFFSLSESV